MRSSIDPALQRRYRPVVSAAITLVLVLSAACASAQTMTEMVAMRDGVNLATDIYLPGGAGPWPVILIRTPYGKAAQFDTAMDLSAAGVAVVVQDMRGRFDSEGVDLVFTTDGDGPLKDGYDTVVWILAQTWCDGKIGTKGGSALGIVQYMLASAAPPGLVVVNPVVATPNMYRDAVFWGGAFRESLVFGWLEGQGSLYFLDDIALHPYEDSFWDPVQTFDRYAAVTVAGLHEGGWYDIFLQGNLDGFVGYNVSGGVGAAGLQKVIIGPWTHGEMYEQAQGELLYPATATTPPYPDAFNTLFNHYLEVGAPGITDTAADIPSVQYYVMGDVDDPGAPGNVWRTADTWPPEAAPVRMHLQAGDGLAETCPGSAGGTSIYTYDPADPSPTLCGGNLMIPAGPCDQRAVEARADVLVFSTGVLATAMEITGRVRAHIFVDIDRPDTDLMVRMTDVYPDGRSMLIADGAARLASRGTTTGLTPLLAGEVVEAVVDLWSTSIIINAGHELRISVTSSNWPRFGANRNNGLDYPASVAGAGSPVVVNVHHESGYASYLEVPDPSRAPGDYVACTGPGGPGDGGIGSDAGAGAGNDAGGGGGNGGGCGCRVGAAQSSPLAALLLLGLVLVGIQRRA